MLVMVFSPIGSVSFSATVVEKKTDHRMGVLIEVFTPQNNSKTATGHLSPPTNNVRDLKSLLLSWKTCILVHLNA